VFKRLSIGLLALLLAACGAPRPRQAPPQSPVEAPSTPNLPGPGRAYRIDESRSELRILVYRAGPLAHLGHNHVIINRSLHGVVDLAETGESVFSMEVPAAGFVVDDAQARSQEGADFAAAVPDDAKAGTLRNMLSTTLLDADEFPTIVVKGAAAVPKDAPQAGVKGGPGSGDVIVAVAISVAGHESTINVPFNLQRDSNHLSARGSLELRQSALGLTPYSLMLGALQVQDAMTIKFDIVADSN
jgi:YceI-like domain